MTMNEFGVRRVAWVLLASVVALMLAILVVFSLSQNRALAKPAAEVAVLQISKEVSAGNAAPGDTLLYTITVGNQGFTPPEATALMTDRLPAELALVPGTLSSDLGAQPVYADGIITWSGALGPNGYAQITFQAEITTEIIYANIVNTAQVTGTGELLEATASTAAFTPMGDIDNADTVKTASAANAAPGDFLTYTIVIQNSELETVYDANLTDTLPVEVSLVPGTLRAVLGDVGYADGVVTWSYTLGPRYADLISFTVQISPDLPYDGWVTNTVDIASPVQAFTRAAGTYVRRPRGVLEAYKMVDPSGQVHVDQRLNYTVYIENTGDATVDAAEMEDVLHPNLNFVGGSLSASSGAAGETDDTITWTGTLAPTENVVITFAADFEPTTPNQASVTNTAEITGAGTLVRVEAGVTAVTMYTVWLPVVYKSYPPITVLNPIPEPDAQHKFNVTWQDSGAAIDYYTLQMGNNERFEDIKKTWSPTGLSQLVYSYCDYYFRVRAENPGSWGHGTWSNVERGHKSSPKPTLNSIPEPEGGELTLSWSAIPALDGWDGGIDRYHVQESDDENFGSVTRLWDAFGTTLDVSEPASGTWYYRVRADDGDCWGEGPWSNTESRSFGVFEYFDDFSDPESGWPRTWTKTRGALYQVAPYEHPNCSPTQSCVYDEGDGYVIARRSGSNPRARFHPGVAVPSANYQLELDARWFDAAYFATYQIFFGSDSGMSNYYAVQVRINDVGDLICEYSVVKQTSDSAASAAEEFFGLPRVAGTRWMQNWTFSGSINCGIRNQNKGNRNWNHFVIRREGNGITVDVNGNRLGSWTDSAYGADRYFGVGATLYEGFTPGKPEFDNWSVVVIP